MGMEEMNEILERWLREDVALTYDSMKENPERAIPVQVVFAAIRARVAEPKKKTI